jgi:hypothetical protein
MIKTGIPPVQNKTAAHQPQPHVVDVDVLVELMPKQAAIKPSKTTSHSRVRVASKLTV